MYKWIEKMINDEEKKPLPILSFPSVQLLYVTVKELVTSSSLQAMGMRMIADKYNMPAALSFMDLSVEAEAFGAYTVYAADEVPTIIGQLVQNQAAADALKVPSVGAGRTGINIEGVKKALKLIGDRQVFAGCTGPFSMAGRLMNVNEVMVHCYEEPEMVHTVLRKVTDFLISYIKEFKIVGADGIVLAEPLAGLLSPQLMQEFSTDYVKEIVDKTQDSSFIVIYHNCGNDVPRLVDQVLNTGCRVFHFGDSVNMAQLLEKMPSDCLLMGNISPSRQFKNGTPKSIRLDTIRLLESCKNHKNFIISSGCDIPPLTEFDNIDSFFETVKAFYYRQRLWDMVM
ncbi:MAG: methyltransferase [Clostridiales bacterium]|nr:methyltransferase [Clostridiales bacterium]